MALESGGVELTPTRTKELSSTNYIDVFDFSTEDLPETVNEEFQRYGNQSIKGFLEKTSSEMPMSSDLVIWSEETRLRNVALGVGRTANVFDLVGHPFRVNEVILINDGSAEDIAHITAITDDTFTAVSVKAGGFDVGTTGLNLFAIGNEFSKGTEGMSESRETPVDTYRNSPVIIKDVDIVNGSDMAQVGWIQDPETGGFFWYLRSRADTRKSFDDYLEMSMIEGKSVESGSAAASAGKKGTEGFFEATDEGNIFTGVATTLDDFDSIIKRLDQQGAIDENMIFTNRDQSLAIDDMLAAQNSYGAGGTSFGVFGDEETSLNLGFTDFRRGEYDFYKTSWKYLNDPTTRGAFSGTGKVNAVLVPAGSTNVYDEVAGENANLPFLHCKYRAGGGEDRRYKTWMIGSAGGARNTSKDVNELHMLSERVLCTMGRNNFVKFVA